MQSNVGLAVLPKSVDQSLPQIFDILGIFKSFVVGPAPEFLNVAWEVVC